MKFFKVALLSVMLSLGLSASDFLSKATNGVLSEDLAGVKQLNSNEMLEVLGGYAFDRASLFDNYGGSPATRSYAFVVINNPVDRDAGAVADEFRLGANELLVAKARYDYNLRKFQGYLQVYNFRTNQKVREYLLDSKGQRVLDDFRTRILGQ